MPANRTGAERPICARCGEYVYDCACLLKDRAGIVDKMAMAMYVGYGRRGAASDILECEIDYFRSLMPTARDRWLTYAAALYDALERRSGNG